MGSLVFVINGGMLVWVIGFGCGVLTVFGRGGFG